MVDYDSSNSLSNSNDIGTSFATNNENLYSLIEIKNVYIEPSNSRRERFKFKLPDNLTCGACQIYNLQHHCELLPTFDFRSKSS